VANMTGTVRCFQISDDAAFTTLEDSGGSTETFILWFAPGTSGGIPRTLTAYTRIMHSMWVSQLREALSNNLSVTLIHPSGSAEVTAVRLGTL